jgi:eukaryotic-like serine/threonine-protein kinase
LDLTPGTRLGPYEIVSAIGKGGMGEVYRATDTNLKRQVALKVLPSALAGDTQRLARFQREAELLAALNHPNIAAIFGIDRSGGVPALVMELVEGEDLVQAIERGPLPVRDALMIARQIAEALEAAHDHGIIHRDLKPGNIKVRSDGTVKVLDFGLAKAMDTTSASEADMTMPGTIIGTSSYMSPEQARGRPVDRRADVWALGAVLFEMLTAQRAVREDEGEPDWSVLPSSTPPAARKLLRRCLARDPKKRLDSAAVARLEIEDALGTTAPESGAGTTQRTNGLVAWGVAAASLLALLATLAAWAPWLPNPAVPETRTDIVTAATDDPASFALSPDGRHIVFSASGDGTLRLWLRSLGATTAQPLVGTEGGRNPFWSPDSGSIGFFTDTALKRLDLAGGAPQNVAPASSGTGATWTQDGFIVFAPSPSSPLMRVSAAGGEAAAVTTFGPQQIGHRWPYALPDGRRFLFYAGGPPDTAGIYVGALDGSTPVRLTPAESAGVYHPGGWLLWVRDGALVAQQLNADQAALVGEPVTVDNEVAVNNFERSAVSVSATGLLAYRTGGARQRQLAWFDSSGKALGKVGPPDPTWGRPRVSPDGNRVVVARTIQGNQDLWLLEGTRMSRFTFDAATDDISIWSPDGVRIVFTSTRTGGGDLYEKLASGAGAEERFVASDEVKTPSSWSRDGRFVLFHSSDPQTSSDLWVAAVGGGRDGTASERATASVLLKTPSREVWGAFSPDDRWVAYMSNESGQPEIFVRPFAAPGAPVAGSQWQVSTSGGIHPVWRPDGKELYYIDPVGALVAAPVRISGSTFQRDTPMVRFSTRILGGGIDAGQGRQYDIAPDGRFLINTVLDDVDAPITLLQHWRTAEPR